MDEDIRIPRVSPRVDHYTWREDAACLDMTWMAAPSRVDEAREVCRGCPVLAECRDWVMDPDTPPVTGVVAGLTMEQRGHLLCLSCGNITLRRESRSGKCWRCWPSRVRRRAAA